MLLPAKVRICPVFAGAGLLFRSHYGSGSALNISKLILLYNNFTSGTSGTAVAPNFRFTFLDDDDDDDGPSPSLS